MKIIKLISVGSYYPMEYIISLLNLINGASQEQYRIDVSFTKGSNIYKCRDTAIKMNAEESPNTPVLQANPYDYILWIDSDQIFNWNNLKACIDSGKDIVTPLIMTDNHTYSVGMRADVKDGEGLKRLTEEELKEKGTDPFEVDNLGFGFTLVKKGVYEKIKFPWHAPIVHEDGSYTSEDHGFCQRALAQGFKLWCLPTQRVLHIKEFPI